jgi:hypothetical protein
MYICIHIVLPSARGRTTDAIYLTGLGEAIVLRNVIFRSAKEQAFRGAKGDFAMQYAELHCRTNFSFLEGASHPDELVVRAAELGYAALAVTDRNSLAGVVRARKSPRPTLRPWCSGPWTAPATVAWHG